MKCKNCEQIKNGSLIMLDDYGNCNLCEKKVVYSFGNIYQTQDKEKIGILVTNDLSLYETLKSEFPNWTVLVSMNTKNVVEFYYINK